MHDSGGIEVFEKLKALKKVNDAVYDMYDGFVLARHNKTPVKPTRIFAEGSGPYSDGGSYALYTCGYCDREFSSGEGVRRLPDGDYVVQCPHCTCVHPSWRKKFEKFGLIVKDE
jgi:hypothetical protein